MHVCYRKLHPCPVSGSAFIHNTWPMITNFFWSLLNQSWFLNQSRAISYHSQVLVNAPVCCCCSHHYFVFLPVSFVSVSTVNQRPGTALPPCGTTDYCLTNLMRMCTKYVRLLFWWRNTLKAVPRAHVKSEVYFGLSTIPNENTQIA